MSFPMPELTPLFLGLTVSDMWPFSSNLEIPFWILLMAAPRWKHTHRICFVSPLTHSLIYFCGMLSAIIKHFGAEFDKVDVGKLEVVYELFRNPDLVFCGWMHYLAFDLLIGIGISMDAMERGASNLFYYFVVVPCLFFTFMLGPIGFLAYIICRTLFLSPIATEQKVVVSQSNVKAKVY